MSFAAITPRAAKFICPCFIVPTQIVSSAKDVVTNAKDVMSGAKGTVSDSLTVMVEKTRGAVQERVEKTKAVVSGSVSTVLESRVARLVCSGVDTALSTSESLVEQYLPLTEDELGEWAQSQRNLV